MRIWLIAALAALAAACSPGAAAKQRFVQNCVGSAGSQYSQEQTQAMCSCMGDRLAAGLTPEQLAIVAKGDDATAEEQQAIGQDPSVMQTMAGAVMSCASTLEQR